MIQLKKPNRGKVVVQGQSVRALADVVNKSLSVAEALIPPSLSNHYFM
jgi:hypothetical protein